VENLGWCSSHKQLALLHMNVLLLGSGGREHAIAWKLSQSSLLAKLYVAPGNAGTDQIATNADLDPMDFSSVGRFIRKHDIAMLVVGPEGPLCAGIVDFFKDSGKFKELIVIGPRKAGAMLEGSKDFAKAFMDRYNIPTAAYKSFTSEQLTEAKAYLDVRTPPYVIKADGLAAGKGVIITSDRAEAEATLDDILIGGAFGEAGSSETHIAYYHLRRITKELEKGILALILVVWVL
jgi:phosphoribosylamine--glycine ligase